MTRKEKLYDLIMNGSVNNVPFNNVQTFLRQKGFVKKNHNGSHEIYEHATYPDIVVNIQNRGGEVKGYQLKQIRSAITQIEILEKAGN